MKDKMQYITLKVYKIYPLICSVLVVLAMNYKFENITGGEYNTAALNNIYKLYNSFYAYNFVDIFVMAAFWALVCYVRKQGIQRDKWLCFFSVLLSILYVVAMSYYKFDSAVLLVENKYQMFLSAICITGYALVIYYSLCLLVFHIKRSVKMTISYNTANVFFDKHLRIVSFGIIFVCWLPWIVMNYPGTISPDSVAQFKQYFGDAVFTAHHPPLSTFIMGTLFEIGNFIWNANFGFFLYILVQTILGALIFSWSVSIIHDLGIPYQYCFIGILYYALLPMW